MIECGGEINLDADTFFPSYLIEGPAEDFLDRNRRGERVVVVGCHGGLNNESRWIFV